VEMREVFGMDLSKLDLIALSGCETGAGEVSQGDEVASLNRAFLTAGSASVAASLWKVADQSTSVLMRALFAHIGAGVSKAEALQRAQKEVRSDGAYAHPYYWAGFVLTGDPGN
jgi:CHAT domain-containing protein